MRIIFFGTPPQAARVLEALIENKKDIIAVVTQPDRERGRGLKVEPSAVKELAAANNIPVIQPEDLSDEAFMRKIGELGPDLCVVVAYGRIIPENVLGIPPHGFINVHASILPKYRGAAPIQWALLNGEAETGISIFKLVGKLDAGDLLLQRTVPIEDSDDAGTLGRKLFDVGSEALLEALGTIEEGRARYVKQDEGLATYAPKIGRDAAAIDWKKSAREICNKVRAFSPAPGACTFHKGKVLKVFRCEPAPDYAASGPPGTVSRLIKSAGFVVNAGDGSLLIKEVQPDSKKRMSAADFTLGARLKIGESLTS